MQKSNKIFSALFVLLAIAEAIGFLTGHNWCFFAAIVCYGISRIFLIDSIQNT
jgi:phosphotransferase system  glucose/maltose/N-acetylglucosamine-specific IIC component